MPRATIVFMYKSAVVHLLVVGLLLTATPAALAVDGPGTTASFDASLSWHAGQPADLPALLHDSCDRVESEEDGCSYAVADEVGDLHVLVPASHVALIDARQAHRSRVPAVVRGRSPPSE